MNKLLIAGSRNRSPDPWDISSVVTLLDFFLEDEYVLISGGAKGADQAGEVWAERHQIAVEQYLPDWNGNGRAAGFIRNKQMIETGLSAAIIFWDGSSKGTKHMLGLLEEWGVPRVVVIT